MSAATTDASAPESNGQPVIDSFLQRLAARDNPPPLRNDPASLRERLAAALRPRLPGTLNRRLLRAAHLCFAFYEQGQWTALALTDVVGGHRGSTTRTLEVLRDEGLVRRPREGRAAYYELTPEGEALLLSVIGPTAAAEPGGGS